MTDAAATTADTYVVPGWRVGQCVNVLLSRNTHPFFIAYLWLRRRASIVGDPTSITPDWSGLDPYLRVPGGPLGKPFLRPFWKGARNSQQEWLNRNLAGSFAPSSFRSEYVSPVVTTNAAGNYVLRDEHWKKALHHFLYDQPLPALAVSAYLLRNRGLISSTPPGPADLIDAFRRDFHFPPEADEEFSTLFDPAWGITSAPTGAGWPSADEPWFEILSATRSDP